MEENDEKKEEIQPYYYIKLHNGEELMAIVIDPADLDDDDDFCDDPDCESCVAAKLLIEHEYVDPSETNQDEELEEDDPSFSYCVLLNPMLICSSPPSLNNPTSQTIMLMPWIPYSDERFISLEWSSILVIAELNDKMRTHYETAGGLKSTKILIEPSPKITTENQDKILPDFNHRITWEYKPKKKK